MGYAYVVRFRVVPSDGPEVVYDLSLLSTTKGPVSTKVEYELERTQHTTLNRTAYERRFGSRPVVRFRFDVVSMTDEPTLAAIFMAASTDGQTVYMSLNGGVLEREVIADGSYIREPLGGKVFAGISVEFSMRCVDGIEAIPQVQTAGGVTQW